MMVCGLYMFLLLLIVDAKWSVSTRLGEYVAVMWGEVSVVSILVAWVFMSGVVHVYE
jgi:hypothetical protein